MALPRTVRPALAATVLWVLFSELAGPWLMGGLYRGSIPAPTAEVTAEIVRLRAAAPLGEHLAAWYRFARFATLGGVLWISFALVSLFPGSWPGRRLARSVAGGTALSLAGIRIATAAVGLLVTLWEDLPSSALLPRELFDAEGLMALPAALPGFEALLGSAPALALLQVATAAALFAVLLGWRVRWTLPAATVGYFLLAGIVRSYSRFFHTGLLPLYLLVLLCFAPSADALSLDRRRLRRPMGESGEGPGLPPEDEPAPAYGWSRLACWLAMAGVYFLAGLSKLRSGGLAWAHPENLRGIVLLDSLQPMHFDLGLGLALADAPAPLFAALGWGAVLLELAYVLVLVSPFARRLLPAAAMGLHLGIWLLQNVLFVDLLLLQVIFWDFRPLLQWLREAGGRWNARGRGREERSSGRAEAGRALAPARGDVGPVRVWGPRGIRALAAVLLLAWAFRLEVFPLSAMQMYAGADLSGVVEYHRVHARLASGDLVRGRPETGIPAMADTRYRWLLRDLFDPPGRDRRAAEAFLVAAGHAANREAPPGERIVAWEVELRRWEVAEPGEREGYGREVKRVVVKVPSP